MKDVNAMTETEIYDTAWKYSLKCIESRKKLFNLGKVDTEQMACDVAGKLWEKHYDLKSRFQIAKIIKMMCLTALRNEARYQKHLCRCDDFSSVPISDVMVKIPHTHRDSKRSLIISMAMKGMTASQIAKETGLSHGYISHTASCKIPDNKNFQIQKNIRKMVCTMTNGQIAESLGISYKKVSNIMSYYHIKRNGVGINKK